MKIKSNKKIPVHEISSGNVFADLGLENPEEELIKADLTSEISHLIKKKKLTQIQAAKKLGVDQPRISSLLNGRLDLFSIEMLMHFLQILDQDIQIVITPKPRKQKRAHLSVCVSNTRPVIPLAAHSH
jgi:predicted XRE-type DNA-binding protein